MVYVFHDASPKGDMWLFIAERFPVVPDIGRFGPVLKVGVRPIERNDKIDG
jgi:hypothetical protein